MNTIIDGKGEKQPTPPPNLGEAETYDIFSSRSHAMDYFTVEGVKLRTGYDSIKDWYIMVVQQCLDNSVDFLQKYYKGYGDTYVDVWITKDAKNKLLRITVRNSNYRNIPVLKNLEHIFNFEMRYGSKQNEKVISRGILGDALKQILSLPYVLLHSKDSSDKGGFKNQQWKHPLIVRRNGQESHVWVIVDIYNQHTTLDIRPIGTNEAVELEGKKRESDNGDDGEDEEEDDDNNNSTEIEVFLPLLTDSNASISMTDIEFFCRKYPIWTTDISSRFSLTNIRDGDDDGESKTTSTEIIFDAIHEISSTWNNKPNVRFCTLDEFVRNFTTTYDKKSTTVYNVLQRFREGSNLKKTEDNQISVKELLSNPNHLTIIERYYNKHPRLASVIPKEMVGKELVQGLRLLRFQINRQYIYQILGDLWPEVYSRKLSENRQIDEDKDTEESAKRLIQNGLVTQEEIEKGPATMDFHRDFYNESEIELDNGILYDLQIAMRNYPDKIIVRQQKGNKFIFC